MQCLFLIVLIFLHSNNHDDSPASLLQPLHSPVPRLHPSGRMEASHMSLDGETSPISAAVSAHPSDPRSILLL